MLQIEPDRLINSLVFYLRIAHSYIRVVGTCSNGTRVREIQIIRQSASSPKDDGPQNELISETFPVEFLLFSI